MAKRMTTSDFIELLEQSTGVVVSVKLASRGGEMTLPVSGIHKGGEGLSRHAFVVYENDAVGRGMGNVKSFLNRVAQNNDDTLKKSCGNMELSKGTSEPYRMDSIFVREFLKRVEAANAEIALKTEEFLANYDDNREAFANKIMQYCIDNKRKSISKKAIANMMKRYPTRAQFQSAGIFYDLTVAPEMYDRLDDFTRDAVDECSRAKAVIYARENISKRCNQVLTRLCDFSDQIINKGKLHGSTIKGYEEAVRVLKISNVSELGTMPEITAFLSVANMAIDNPVQTIDSLIMGFMRFYYTQGMLDYLPYDDLDECYGREMVEEIGQDPNNGFDVLSRKLLASEI